MAALAAFHFMGMGQASFQEDQVATSHPERITQRRRASYAGASCGRAWRDWRQCFSLPNRGTRVTLIAGKEDPLPRVAAASTGKEPPRLPQ
jgi:hypothetical protein